MAEDSKDKLREARELFEQSRKTFFEAHKQGMESLDDLTGREQAERFGDAIEQERQAIDQMSEAIELQREAIVEQSDSLGQKKDSASAPLPRE